MKSVESTNKSKFGQNIKTNQALPTIRLNVLKLVFWPVQLIIFYRLG